MISPNITRIRPRSINFMTHSKAGNLGAKIVQVSHIPDTADVKYAAERLYVPSQEYD